MDDQQLLQLLEKYLRNECTEEEKQAVEGWYGRFESRRAATAPDAAPALEAVYRNMVAELQQEGEWGEAPVRRIRSRWWAAAAAVLVLAAGLSIWLLRKPAMETVQTAAGQRTNITLPDGTRVWLNVSSRLEYAKSMNDGRRNVYLQGEGYFEVAQNGEHPFVIHTEDLSVQVLGTAFNLRAYPEDGSLETALVAGKVAVNLRSNPRKKQLLNPGEKLLLTRKRGAAEAGRQDWGEFTAEVMALNPGKDDNTAGESMWRDDRLQFKNKSFGELAKIMERWFDKRIIIRDTALNDNRFSGEFRKEDIKRALKALQLTAEFTYDIKGDTVYIKH